MTGRRPQVSILRFVFPRISDCPLGETDADGEEGGGKLDDIEEPLRGRFKQHRGDVNRGRS